VRLLLRGALVVLPVLASCRVYDETLLLRDAATDTPPRDTGTDLGVDAPADVPGDAPADAVDVIDLGAPDVPRDAGQDAPDGGADAGVDGGRDAGQDVPVDMPVDVPPSCDELLRQGRPCIEPWSGHAASLDDNRVLAPRTVAVLPGEVLVSDDATGRLMGYTLTSSGASARRVAGNGIVAAPVAGPVLSSPFGAITAVVQVAAGVLLVADAESNSVYRVEGGVLAPVGLGRTLNTGPFGMVFDATASTLYFTADNRVWSLALSAEGRPSEAAVAVVGQSCGTACTLRFNGDGMAGTETAVNNPMGLALSAEHVYFADRDNCRVRRFARTDPAHTVQTYMGSTCDASGDPLRGSTTAFTDRTSLRLGAVTGVAAGTDGSVYALDEQRCAVFGAVPPPATLSRVVVGSRQGCGQLGISMPPLGRLGSIAIAADGLALYFTDVWGQRLGRVRADRGMTPTLDYPFGMGRAPSALEGGRRLRLGRPIALGVDPADTTRLLAATEADGRLYRFGEGDVETLVGDGLEQPVDTVMQRARDLAPTRVVGISLEQGRTTLGLPERGAIADLVDGGLRRIAGEYPTLGADGGLVDAGPRDAAFFAPRTPYATPGFTFFADERGRVWRVSTTAQSLGIPGVYAGAGPDGGAPDSPAGITATTAGIGAVGGLAMDTSGRLYVTDPRRAVVWSIGNEEIPRARILAGLIDRRAPQSDRDEMANTTALNTPQGVAYDGTDRLFVADEAAGRVRVINIRTGRMETLAGRDDSDGRRAPSGDFGPARDAVLSRPMAVAYAPGRLYVAEYGSGRVRVVRLPN
jgi:hypothetical protein